jgi:hypothetical protein
VSRLRWPLVALLVVSTALFAAGVIAERSDADNHAEPASVRADEHTESVEQHEAAEPGELQAESNEAVLGIDVESTPLIVLAVIFGLALALLAATRFGQLPGVLTAIALVALGWAALDIREVLHQVDESRTGVALVAAAVAVLHLASAALAGRLGAQARRADPGSPGRPGTMPA